MNYVLLKTIQYLKFKLFTNFYAVQNINVDLYFKLNINNIFIQMIVCSAHKLGPWPQCNQTHCNRRLLEPLFTPAIVLLLWGTIICRTSDNWRLQLIPLFYLMHKVDQVFQGVRVLRVDAIYFK